MGPVEPKGLICRLVCELSEWTNVLILTDNLSVCQTVKMKLNPLPHCFGVFFVVVVLSTLFWESVGDV